MQKQHLVDLSNDYANYSYYGPASTYDECGLPDTCTYEELYNYPGFGKMETEYYERTK